MINGCDRCVAKSYLLLPAQRDIWSRLPGMILLTNSRFLLGLFSLEPLSYYCQLHCDSQTEGTLIILSGADANLES
jgi:hypothetical protein